MGASLQNQTALKILKAVKVSPWSVPIIKTGFISIAYTITYRARQFLVVFATKFNVKIHIYFTG